MFKGQKIDGGKVHIFKESNRHVATFCTGRSMSFVVAVSDDTHVDCAACVKRAVKNGMDAQAV